MVGIATLLWNSVGIISFTTTRLGMLGQLGMTPEQIAYFETFPLWANIVWGLGVWGAFASSALLLLRSRWAVEALLVSVVGLVGTTIFEQFATTVPEGMSNPALNAAIWVITLATLVYARRMRGADVLR